MYIVQISRGIERYREMYFLASVNVAREDVLKCYPFLAALPHFNVPSMHWVVLLILLTHTLP